MFSTTHTNVHANVDIQQTQSHCTDNQCVRRECYGKREVRVQNEYTCQFTLRQHLSYGRLLRRALHSVPCKHVQAKFVKLIELHKINKYMKATICDTLFFSSLCVFDCNLSHALCIVLCDWQSQVLFSVSALGKCSFWTLATDQHMHAQTRWESIQFPLSAQVNKKHKRTTKIKIFMV